MWSGNNLAVNATSKTNIFPKLTLIIFVVGSKVFNKHPKKPYPSPIMQIFLCLKSNKIRKQKGFLSAIFLICYGCSRIFIEFFRVPDQHIGYIFNFITIGQILSLPMIALGCFLIVKKDNFFTKL